jgi:hypothetical protein
MPSFDWPMVVFAYGYIQLDINICMIWTTECIRCSSIVVFLHWHHTLFRVIIPSLLKASAENHQACQVVRLTRHEALSCLGLLLFSYLCVSDWQIDKPGCYIS